MTSKVLVVGATGFLGKRIHAAVAKKPGLAAVGMSRRAQGQQSTESSVSWVQADLMNRASLDKALEGVDVVVASANGYMHESLDADLVGYPNLIDAAVAAKVKRFVLLSITAAEHAGTVPHFHAKKLSEDKIKASGLNYVFVRAPAFLDQEDDYIADAARSGKFYGVGDADQTRWSYVYTGDLADYTAAAAAEKAGSPIERTSIDVGWKDGAMTQGELHEAVQTAVGKPLARYIVPWWLLATFQWPVWLFKWTQKGALSYDMILMFQFFRSGRYVSDITLQEKFFGPAPTARDAVSRWAAAHKLTASSNNNKN